TRRLPLSQRATPGARRRPGGLSARRTVARRGQGGRSQGNGPALHLGNPQLALVRADGTARWARRRPCRRGVRGGALARLSANGPSSQKIGSEEEAMTTEPSVVSYGEARIPNTGQYAWCISRWIPSSQKCRRKPQPWCDDTLT